ncbi:hypothetical protein Tco_0787158 [Tanacetum coccineum]
MLKVSPWKGVIRFGKRGKLNPRYIRPFKILAKVRTIAYQLELPEQRSRVHNTFHVSNLNKCLFDDTQVILLDEIHINDKFHFIKEPVEIMDREVKRLKQSRILVIKVRCNSRRGLEFTWEREDQLFRGERGTSTAWVILFGTISTAIPATVLIVDPPIVHDDTPLIPTKTPTIPHVVSTLPHTSPFLYTDSFDNDTSKRLPLQDPYDVTIARWRSRVAIRSSPPTLQILPAPPGLPRRPTIIILPGQPIPVGRPYLTQPNEVCKMLIARKRVRALPSGRLASRYPPDHSSSDHFSSDDSSLDSPSDSSSGYSLDTSSGRSIKYSSFDTPAVSFVGPSRKRRRSLAILVPLATPVLGAFSPIRADLLPPHKRIRGAVTASDYDDSFEESYKAYTEPDIDSDVQADIDGDTMAAEAASAREADVGVEVGIGSDGEDEA